MALGLAAVAFGIGHYGLLAQAIWTPSGLRSLAIYTGVFWAAAFAFPRYARAGLPMVVAGIVVAYAGWAAAAALVVTLVGAYGIGSRVAANGVTAVAAGLSAYAVITGLLARIPLPTHAPYWLLGAVGVVLARRWRPRMPSLPPLLTYLGSLHILAALFPEAGSDALAMRLTLPAWIAEHGKWDFDPSHFVWSVMPMNGDWAFAFVYLLGGGEAALRLLNAGCVLLTAWAVFGLARRFATADNAELAAALFLSTPLCYFMSGSVFVESFWTFLICAALYEALEEGRELWLAGALSGVAFGAKLLAFVFAAPLLVIAAWRRRAFVGPMLLALALGLPPYIEAWVKTGNPVFPNFNTVFRSPMFTLTMPVIDLRYPAVRQWDFLWVATFDTSRYLEGQDGSFGFQHLVLLLPALVVWRQSPWTARVLLWSAIGTGGVVLSQIGYLRYALPAFALAAAAFAFVVSLPHMRAVALVLVAVNTYFLASSTFYTKNFWPPYSAQARDEYLREAAPVRKLVDYFNREAHGEPVAFLDDDQIAGLAGKAYAATWHTWRFRHALDAAASPADVLALWKSLGIRWATAPALSNWYASPHAAARGLLLTCGEAAATNGNFAAWRIREDCGPNVDEQYLSGAPVVEPGTYDDIDPAVRYIGPWLHDHQFAETFGHTLTYTATPGNFWQLRFRGRRVRVVYTAAANRGVSEVAVDGRAVGVLDQRSDATRWQAEQSFDAGELSEHRLRVTLRSGKPGDYLDLDRLIVE